MKWRIGLCAGLMLLCGCSAISDFFVPPLAKTADTEGSRTVLRLITKSQMDTWMKQRARGLLLPFRCQDNQAKLAPEDAQTFDDFLECTDQMAAKPPYQTFTFEGVAGPVLKVIGAGIKNESRRYKAEYSAFGNSSVFDPSKSNPAHIAQGVRLIQIERFSAEDPNTPAACLILRVDFDSTHQALQFKPAYFRVNRSYAKVAGMRLDCRPWSWIWPWMWIQSIYGAFDGSIYDVSYSAHLEATAIHTWEGKREAFNIGVVDFKLPSVRAQRLPFERTCKSKGFDLPSPYLPIPSSDSDLASVPMNLRVSMTESNSLGESLNTLGGLLSDNSKDLAQETSAILGFGPTETPSPDPTPTN
jgi:hypothetical protein